MRKYRMQICMIAAVALLGTAVFCGFKIYHHFAQVDKQTAAFEQIAEVVEQSHEEALPEHTPVSEGEIFYRGVKTSGSPVYRIARLGVGRTFQNLKLFGSMSVLENLMIGAHQMTKIGLVRFLVDLPGEKREEKLLTERAEQVLEEIGLADLRHEKVKNLAYGKQKMTELGRALMLKPALLILDEPAAGLNPSERREFVDILLKTHERGIDLFLIEHNMDVVMNISTKITVLNFGAKIAEGTPYEIQNNDEVIRAYLGDKYKPVEG